MRYFDLHCDTLTELGEQDLFSNSTLHISLNRAPDTYLQCFAVFIPDSLRGDDAWEYYLKHRDIFFRYSENGGIIRITDAETLAKAAEYGKGGLLTVESGAVLGGKLSRIEKLRRDGVAMLTLTWNGENELGFGSSENKGLTSFGKEAVKELENCGITVDVSHLSERGFADLCEISARPFVASHSNCDAVRKHRRNLKNWQVTEIVNRGGLIGVNIYSEFLSRKNADIKDIAKHISHLEKLNASYSICFGADFDGIHTMPKGISGIESVSYLRLQLEKLGVSEERLEKYFYGNAFDFYNRLWRNQK